MPAPMWRKLIGVVGVALAAGATGVLAATLPAVASADSPTATATDGPCLSDREATIAPMAQGSPAPVRSPSRVRFRGQKVVGRQLQRSEAGVVWSLSPKVSLELNYERSALAPMMPNDHDDGFLTRFKLGF